MPLADAALEALAQSRFFSEEALGHVANAPGFLKEKRVLNEGSVLMEPGTPTTIWFVRKGSILVVHPTATHTVLDGELIGHRATVAGLPVSFKVVAKEDKTECYCVNTEAFFQENVTFDPVLVNIVRAFQEHDTTYDGLTKDQLNAYLKDGL
jgi:CRP-like cAMP-binding protein